MMNLATVRNKLLLILETSIDCYASLKIRKNPPDGVSLPNYKTYTIVIDDSILFLFDHIYPIKLPAVFC